MQQPFISSDNILVRIIVEPRYRWLRHLIIALLMTVNSYENALLTFSDDLHKIGREFHLQVFVQTIIYLGAIYLNIYVLVPRLFLKRRYAFYSLCLFIILTLIFILSYYIEYWIINLNSLEPSEISYLGSNHLLVIDYITALSVNGLCCLGTTITILFRNWLTDGKKKSELEARHGKEAIHKMKDSLSPAFLLEILTIAARNSEEDAAFSTDILSRLSRFLRYRLYDSNRNLVMLNSEIAFLDNYLSLVRDSRHDFNYSISHNGAKTRTTLPPSIIINLIESILDNVRKGQSVDLRMEINTDQKAEMIFDFIVRSAGIPSASKIETVLNKVLAFSSNTPYCLAVRGGGGSLYIHFGLNQFPGI